ncbi:MAG: hypothetical protein AAB772_01205 [Patescibacteria group bacterium]
MAFENVVSHKGLAKSYEVRPRKICKVIDDLNIYYLNDRQDSRYLFEKFERAEAYDISHLSGREAVGAMTAWVKKNGVWEADKKSWRKFKIRTAPKSDDPRAIAEVINRRFNHPEWPFPDLVIIDGGLTQLRAAVQVIKRIKTIKVISFAKPNKLIYGLSLEPLKLKEVSSDLAKLIQKAIYFTHNFAIRYHRRLRNHF